MASRKGKPRDRTEEPEALAARDVGPRGEAAPVIGIPAAAPTRRILDSGAPPSDEAIDDLSKTLEAPSAPGILLVEAAEAVLSEHGLARATDVEIARRAGLTTEVFHAHFASRTAMLHAVTDKVCAALVIAAADGVRRAVWERVAPNDVVATGARSVVDELVGRAAVVRAVLTAGDERLLEGLRNAGAGIAARTGKALAEVDGAPAEKDIAFVILLAIALAHHAARAGLELDRAELAERAASAAAAYLGARSAS